MYWSYSQGGAHVYCQNHEMAHQSTTTVLRCTNVVNNVQPCKLLMLQHENTFKTNFHNVTKRVNKIIVFYYNVWKAYFKHIGKTSAKPIFKRLQNVSLKMFYHNVWKRLLNILEKCLDVKPWKYLQNIFFKGFAKFVLSQRLKKRLLYILVKRLDYKTWKHLQNIFFNVH